MYDLKVLNHVHDVTLDKMTLNILKANEELLLIIKLRICLICSSIGDNRYAGNLHILETGEKIANTVKRRIFLHNDSHRKPNR